MSLPLPRDPDARWTEAEDLRELGHSRLLEGRHHDALECFGRSARLFRRLESIPGVGDLWARGHELEGLILQVVKRIGLEVEARDRYQYGHSARVAAHAVAIACDLGFDADAMKGILVAGYLHDVGKLQIETRVLNKAGRLTEAEMDAVRRHPVLGADLLSRFDLPWEIGGIVRWHHERWDGTGYPDGLARERIPLGARILQVADVYDALTTARSYRAPWTREQALAYLEMSAGTLSDPEVTRTFVAIAWREGYRAGGLAEVGAAGGTSPAKTARTFAALPRTVADWSRVEEELART